MKIPKISHETWEWTRGLAHLAVDTETVDAEELSFEDQVRALLTVEPLEQIDDMDTDRYNYTHAHYEPGTKITIYPNSKDQVHRPEVGDATVRDLAEWVDTAHYAVSPGSLSFEDQLRVLCENCEEYFEKLQVYIDREEVDIDRDIDAVIPDLRKH